MPVAELHTPIRWPLRAWMAVEVLFGLAAISTIFLRPQDTDTGFAWPIEPVVAAAALGAFYLAAAPLFVLPLFARSWQHVRVVVLPAAAFATAMLGATFLHWDRFSVGTFPFALWFASYLLPPPIFVGLYVWHQRGAAPVGTGIGAPLAPAVRALLRVNGVVVTGIAVLGFAVPAALIAVAPWTLTPLTARTLCGWLLAVGLLQLSMAAEGDRRRARLAATMLVVLPFALAVQLLRFPEQVDAAAASLWLLGADLVVVALACTTLWARSPEPAAVPR
ncbi:MAG: hypothetical protein ACT4RN_16190 [Pseudonocardia sp.]